MRISRAFLSNPSWRTAVIALLLASLLVPLIVGSGFFFPYVVPRNLFFRAVVEVGVTALVLALSFGGKKLDLRGEPIFWSLAAFLLLGIGLAGYLASAGVRYRLVYLAAAGVNLLALTYAENRSTLVGIL